MAPGDVLLVQAAREGRRMIAAYYIPLWWIPAAYVVGVIGWDGTRAAWRWWRSR